MVRAAYPIEQRLNRVQAEFNAVHLETVEELKRCSVGHIVRKARGEGQEASGGRKNAFSLAPRPLPLAPRLFTTDGSAAY